MPTVVEQLRAALGADVVLVGRDVSARAASWIDPSPLEAAALVRPRTTEQVVAIVRLAAAVKLSIWAVVLAFTGTHAGRVAPV